jgi:predicted PurR-regulated permease PerM
MSMISDSIGQIAAAMIVAAFVIVALIVGQTVLVPLAGAIIISFILSPLVRKLVSFGAPNAVSVIGVVGLALVLIVSASTLLSVELLSITSRMGDYRGNLAAKARDISALGREDGVLTRAAETVSQLSESLSREFTDRTQYSPESASAPNDKVVVAQPGQSTSSLLNILSEPVAKLALLIVFTIFLLLQHQDMRDRIVRILGPDNLSETTSAMSEAGKRLSGLFLAQTIMSVGYGILIAAVLWIAGLPGALVWGVLAGVMRFVPFIGSYIAAVPPVILAAGVDPGWWLAIFVGSFFIVSELVMGNVVEPLVLGRRVGLSPFAMIAAASFWTLVWGPVGLLLAAPLTMTIVVLGRYVRGLSFVTVLLGDEPPLEPEQELYYRLLSSDDLAAAEQIETATENNSLAHAADNLVLPALMLAAQDTRVGRLTEHQTAALRETLSEASELHPGLMRQPADDEAAFLLVAARGEVDLIGTSFLSRVIESDTKQSVRAIMHATGLSALSLNGCNADDTPPGHIVIASLSGLPRRQLQLMAARATRSFPGASVIVLDPAAGAGAPIRPARSEPQGAATSDAKYVETVGELIENLKINHSVASAEVPAETVNAAS